MEDLKTIRLPLNLPDEESDRHWEEIFDDRTAEEIPLKIFEKR